MFFGTVDEDWFELPRVSGQYSSCAILANGSAWCWGPNTYGELGTNSLTATSSPVSVVGENQFSKIAMASNTTYGIRRDGTAWAWGRNNYGQAGNNTTGTSYSSPVSVVGGNSYTQISTGSTGSHTAAIRGSDGRVWCWGLNVNGQCGDSSTGNSRSSPVSVIGAVSCILVAAGQTHTLAIRGDNGTARAWGLNTSGQLGDNTLTNRSAPVSVVGGNSYAVISAGYAHTLAIRGSDGTAWAWGSNSAGQCGTNTVGNSYSSPVSVVGGNSYIDISTGYTTAAAIRGSDGTAWCWGSNFRGQCGDGTSGNSYSSPVSVVGNHSFIKISSGTNYTCALKNDGSIWAWGWNAAGRLGTNNFTDASSPVLVCKLPG